MKSLKKVYIIDIESLPEGMSSEKFAKIWDEIDEDMIDEVFPTLKYKIIDKDDLNFEGLGERDENTGDEE